MYFFIIFFTIFLFFNKFGFSYNILYYLFDFNWFNIKYWLAIDSISIFFIILCLFLLIICLILNWYLIYKINLFLFTLILLFLCLICIFFTNDAFILFIFFEFIIFPLFIIVGIWGSRERKVFAAYQLFVFTLIGSIFALFGFLYLYSIYGSFNFIYYYSLDLIEYKYLVFFFLFFGFSVKVPIIPLHMWLPEAHVEAPTVGSVILAGIILKLSFYIYLRLLIFFFSSVIFDVLYLLFVIFIIGIILPSFFSIAQIDMKKVIAYSSISHMNYSLIGLFNNNIISLLGSTFMMFGHALVSSALFISIGIIYDRYKSRILFYYGGLVLIMPLFISLFFIFILSNFGMPLTINFVGEFVIFIDIFYTNSFLSIITLIGMFLTMLYSLFLYNRISTGPLKLNFIYFFSDISRREFYLLFILLFFVIFFGIFPSVIFDYFFSNLFFI